MTCIVLRRNQQNNELPPPDTPDTIENHLIKQKREGDKTEAQQKVLRRHSLGVVNSIPRLGDRFFIVYVS